MNHTPIKITLALAVFFVAGCGENPVPENQVVNEEKILQDTLREIQNGVSVVEEKVEAQEELLAQNLEEKSQQTKNDDEYIKTELNDVVLSRKTPNTFGIGEGEDGSGTDPVRGVGLKTGPGDEGLFFGDPSSDQGNGSSPRHTTYEPVIKNPTAEEGFVSLKLKVNAAGEVTSAVVIESIDQTNTFNEQLWAAAKKYALQYRFTPNSDEPWQTTMEYIKIEFKL